MSNADTMVAPPPQATLHRRLLRFAVRWFILLAATYLVVLVVMLFIENKLVYQPSPASEWREPDNARTQDVWLEADGQTIHAWWLPPQQPDAGALLLCHGNGGNLSHRGRMADDLNRMLGLGVLMFDYPGYGKSTGKPSERGCHASSDAAFRWLTDVAKLPPNRIVLMGESLGGGTAVELATRHDCRALVLLYTFTSLPAAAKYHYRWLPTHSLMRNRFDNLAKIGNIKQPVFIAHGTADTVIPYWQSEVLFAAANEPKKFLTLDGYPHGLIENEPFYSSLAQFLAAHPSALN